MARILVQADPFDTGAELAALTAGRDDIGGLGCFVGLVRQNLTGRRLVAMTLEHYPTMTEKALARIAAEAETRWSLLGCTIIHRYGRLTLGEPIVLVLTASAHRAAALDSTAFLIDWLKTQAPFWKNEEFEDGEREWVAARKEDDEATDKWKKALLCRVGDAPSARVGDAPSARVGDAPLARVGDAPSSLP